jgi:di/tricarboxylate transporter
VSYEGYGVLLVVVAAVLLFATEAIAADLVALLAMCALVLSGIIDPGQGLSGFSDGATVAVGGMLVLSAGLASTGAVSSFPALLAPLFRKSVTLGLAVMMLVVSLISALINNTACVAVFLPVCLGVSRITGISPSKLLMPLSFAAIFGGTCTLIGTSPNLIVSSLAQNHGLAPFGMFEFSALGLLTLLVGLVYMLTVGRMLLPGRRQAGQMTTDFGMATYLAEIVVLAGAPSLGQPLAQSSISTEIELEVMSLTRGQEVIALPPPSTLLIEGDLLLVSCDVDALKEIQQRQHLRLKTDRNVQDRDLQERDGALLEVLIPPGSALVKESLESYDFRSRLGGTAIALRQRGEPKVIHRQVAKTRLMAGDVLLVEVRRERLDEFKSRPEVVVISESRFDRPQRRKMVTAIVIFATVVGLAALGLLPIEVASVAGAVMMVLTGCLTREAAYQALDIKVLALIAGSMSLGVAMEKTGVAALLGKTIVSELGSHGPMVLISATYLAAMLLTALISNAATAALMTPLAIASAHSVHADPRPFLVAVTFACSASFMTPIGYQTNTMIYGPGQYRFADFLKVGIPLNLLLWGTNTLLIPYFFPF